MPILVEAPAGVRDAVEENLRHPQEAEHADSVDVLGHDARTEQDHREAEQQDHHDLHLTSYS